MFITVQQPVISSTLTFIAGLLLGQMVSIIQLIRDLNKDKESEKSKPKFKIEVNDPSEPSRQHTRLLTFDIWNKGGGLSAISPTVVCKVEEAQRKEYAVKWHSDTIQIPDDITMPEFIQSWLDDNRWFTASKIDHEGHETIDLLFTTDHNELAYFLDSNKTQLALGKHYNIMLKVKATHVQAHIRRFDIDLTRWNTVKATEIT